MCEGVAICLGETTAYGSDDERIAMRNQNPQLITSFAPRPPSCPQDLGVGLYTDVVLVPGDVGPTTLHSLLLSAASTFLCTLLS